MGKIRVALVGFAPYPWAQDLNDHAAARRLVREADAHADVVVVTMHAGAEGSDRGTTPRATEHYLGETAATSARSRMLSSTPAPTSSPGTAPTSSAGWSGTAAA